MGRRDGRTQPLGKRSVLPGTHSHHQAYRESAGHSEGEADLGGPGNLGWGWRGGLLGGGKPLQNLKESEDWSGVGWACWVEGPVLTKGLQASPAWGV